MASLVPPTCRLSMRWRTRLPPGIAKRAFTEPRTFSVQRTPGLMAGGSVFIVPVRVTGAQPREGLANDAQGYYGLLVFSDTHVAPPSVVVKTLPSWSRPQPFEESLKE